MSRTFVIAAALAASPSLTSAGEVYKVDPSHSDVTFQVRHFVSKVGGQFREFEGAIQVDPAKPETSSVEFSIQAASIDTRNADRDKHLRSADFLDAEKHPVIRFQSTRVTPRGNDKYDVTGNLTLRGQTREVTLPVAFLGFVNDPWGNKRAGFEASYTVNRKDFGIVWNQALDSGGFILGDDVQLAINLETIQQKEKASAQ